MDSSDSGAKGGSPADHVTRVWSLDEGWYQGKGRVGTRVTRNIQEDRRGK